MATMLINDQHETYFFIYCCTIGIIGNTFTCFLLKRRINRFKSYLASKRASLDNVNSTKRSNPLLHIDKCILFDYRHNWNLYLYFIGVNIFDTIILLNWILSRWTLRLGYPSRFGYKVEDEYSHLDSQLIESSHFDPRDRDRLVGTMFDYEIDVNFNQSFNDLLFELGAQLKYFDRKLINIQGVCQIYYYFSIVALQASLAYTLMCLLDRMFKLKCINRDIVESLKKGKFALLQRSTPANDPFHQPTTSTSKKSPKFKDLSGLFNPRNQQLRALTKSGHSEMIKQFFGRTSAYFIGLIIIYFYFHLMWLFGVTEHDHYTDLNPTNEAYRLLVNSTSSAQPLVVGVRLEAVNRVTECQMFNLNNRLPFFIMAFDLIILVFTEGAKIVCILFLFHYYFKRVRAQVTADAQKLQNRYLLINCVLIFSFIGLIFEMPSLIMRNIQIFLIIQMSYLKQISESNLATNMSSLDALNELSNKHKALTDRTIIFDNLLFIASSHKFILFLIFAHLVGSPLKWACWSRRRRRLSRDDDDLIDETPLDNNSPNRNVSVPLATTSSRSSGPTPATNDDEPPLIGNQPDFN